MFVFVRVSPCVFHKCNTTFWLFKKKFYGVNLSNQPHNLLLHSPTAWLECTEINRVIHFPCGQRLLLLILEDDVILWEGKWCRWPVTEVKGHSSRSFVWLWFLRVTARPIIFRGEVCLLRSSVRFPVSLLVLWWRQRFISLLCSDRRSGGILGVQRSHQH